MKIGELPYREFSYCFLSDMPKCEAGHTPTVVCVVYYRYAQVQGMTYPGRGLRCVLLISVRVRLDIPR